MQSPAICPNGHRRTVPYRPLNTSDEDRTPLYGRQFKCRACGSIDVTLSVIESQAELDKIRSEIDGPPRPLRPHSTHPSKDPYADFL